MNLLDKGKAGLIALLALFLFSCESDDNISLSFDPNIENINAHYTELTLPFKLVQLDSVNTTNPQRFLLGNYLNAQFGRTQAVCFSEFDISSKGTITAEDVFDSLSLTLVNNYFYGATEADLPLTFAIYQLTDTIENKNFYRFESAAYQPQPLARFTFTPDPDVASSNDTLQIRLSDVLGSDLFEKAKSNAQEMSTDSAFREYFKGIALVPESENNYMAGFSSAGIRLTLYYSTPSETESSITTFGLGSYTYDDKNRSTILFNNIEYDRSGTPLAGITMPREESQASDSNLYLQSGTGLSPLIDFQPLVDFVNNIKSGEEKQYILLNRVEFHMGVPVYGTGIRPPAAIRGYEVDENFRREITYLPAARQNVFIGLFADNANRAPEASAIELDSLSYNSRITNYMQFLADEDLEETEFLWIADGFESSVNQFVTSPDSVRLKVYYTILK